MIPVLISSAGRRAALVQTFRAAGAVVHGCDMQPVLSSGCMLADQAHQVPRCSAPDFIDRIEEIVRAEEEVCRNGLPIDAAGMRRLKAMGFSDKRLAWLALFGLHGVRGMRRGKRREQSPPLRRVRHRLSHLLPQPAPHVHTHRGVEVPVVSILA